VEAAHQYDKYAICIFGDKVSQTRPSQLVKAKTNFSYSVKEAVKLLTEKSERWDQIAHHLVNHSNEQQKVSNYQ